MNYDKEILNLKKIKDYLEDLTVQLDADGKSNIGDFTEASTTNIRKAIIKLKSEK